MRQAVKLAMENAAGFEHSRGFAHVFGHHVAAGDVLENRVRVNELKRIVRELPQAGAIVGMEMGVGNIGQPLASQDNHFVGDIDAVDFAEVAAQRFHQTAGAASDFERSPSPAVGFGLQPLQLRFDGPQNVGGRGQKFRLILIPSSKGNVIVRVFPGALVPIGAHALADGAAFIHKLKVAQARGWCGDWCGVGGAKAAQHATIGRLPRPAGSESPVKLDLWIAAALFIADLLLLGPWVTLDYSDQPWNNGYLYTGIARMFRDRTSMWNALQYGGSPFHYLYPPVFPSLVALVPFLSIGRAFHLISGIGYALAPACLYLFARQLFGSRLLAIFAALSYAVFPSPIYLLPKVRALAHPYAYAPWSYLALVGYDEAPHALALPLTLLALTAAWRKRWTLASVLAGGVFLTSWPGMIGLGFAIPGLVLARWRDLGVKPALGQRGWIHRRRLWNLSVLDDAVLFRLFEIIQHHGVPAHHASGPLERRHLDDYRLSPDHLGTFPMASHSVPSCAGRSVVRTLRAGGGRLPAGGELPAAFAPPLHARVLCRVRVADRGPAFVGASASASCGCSRTDRRWHGGLFSIYHAFLETGTEERRPARHSALSNRHVASGECERCASAGLGRVGQ